MKKPKAWTGRAVGKARATVATWLPAPCPRCGEPVTPDQAWHIDHIPNRSQLPPEAWYDPQYWHPAHAHCNTSAGAAHGNRTRGIKRKQQHETQEKKKTTEH